MLLFIRNWMKQVIPTGHLSFQKAAKTKILFSLMSLAAMLVLAACQEADSPTPDSATIPDTAVDPAYPNSHLLVSVDWVLERLDDPGIRIIDMRGAEAFNQAHIPGAVNIPVGDIVATVDGVPFVFEESSVQEALNRGGLTPEMTAVIYDDLGMMDAARLFWTLEYVGHAESRIVNGGWNAWSAAEVDTAQTASVVEPTQYPIEADKTKIVTADEVLERLENPEVILVDARSPQEFSGEVTFSERAGRIPGSVNLVWLDTLMGGDVIYTTEPGWQAVLQDEDVEVFKSGSEIQAMLDALDISPEKEIITYCQTLWRGAHVYFVLRLMGFEEVRGYDGAWAEWGNRADLPVEAEG